MDAQPPIYLPSIEATGGDDLTRHLKAAGQPVPQIRYLLGYRPEWTVHLSRFTQAVMRGPSSLTPGMRELIAAFTSRRNDCPF